METETRTKGWGGEDGDYLTLKSDTSGNICRLIGSGSAIPRGIISVDRKWRLKVANSFGIDWRLFDDVIPR